MYITRDGSFPILRFVNYLNFITSRISFPLSDPTFSQAFSTPLRPFSFTLPPFLPFNLPLPLLPGFTWSPTSPPPLVSPSAYRYLSSLALPAPPPPFFILPLPHLLGSTWSPPPLSPSSPPSPHSTSCAAPLMDTHIVLRRPLPLQSGRSARHVA